MATESDFDSSTAMLSVRCGGCACVCGIWTELANAYKAFSLTGSLIDSRSSSFSDQPGGCSHVYIWPFLRRCSADSCGHTHNCALAASPPARHKPNTLIRYAHSLQNICNIRQTIIHSSIHSPICCAPSALGSRAATRPTADPNMNALLRMRQIVPKVLGTSHQQHQQQVVSSLAGVR